MKREVFKEIPQEGYENFRISNRGRILNASTGNILKPLTDKDGYQVISLNLKGIGAKQVKIHRLVGLVFVPNPDDKPQINHLDGNKANNYYKNVEWTTPKENGTHASANNLIRKGETKPNSKLSDEAIPLIRESIKRKESLTSIARDYGVSISTIWQVKKGTHWKHIAQC